MIIDVFQSSVFDDKSQNFINLIIFDGTATELDFVGNLIKVEPTFE